MQVISLSSLIESSSNESEVYEYLASFSCVRNPDVEEFLHSKAIENEKRSLSRTNLVIDPDRNNEIAGYFTLAIKPFPIHQETSNTARKKITGNKDGTVFNAILIAQLARADMFKGIVSGSEILKLALHNCKLIHDLSALRMVCVEYKDDAFLNSFYEEVGEFTFLQTNENNLKLSYIRID
ncbi:hypothetical protein ABEP42_27125 [Priestia megaterium]|uniref:hypothetical protein n=1 Tax=Priestia TaxID=2800373 RepID=UPI001C96CC49|nr:hypothetical protein [Priestia flexa]MBY6087017.1 hypothetical protein [Priestia flexa]